MSHSTVLVIGKDYEKQLEPFDENRLMARYVRHTKKELIAKGRKEIEDFKNGRYAEFLKDTEKYKRECPNLQHLEYVEVEFPKKLKWTDSQIYKDQIRFYDKKEIGPEGEVYSTYNPHSKWDWYQLGGRWSGFFILKKGKKGKLGNHRLKEFDPSVADLPPDRADQARKGDIDFVAMRKELADQAEKWWKEFKSGKGFWDDKKDSTKKEFISKHSKVATFAVLKDGVWYEQGEMGWWGVVRDEKDPDKWQGEFDKLINGLPDNTLLSVVDVHI